MENSTLTHWGVRGMRWGIRRYQNSDGSLTPAGKKRYGDDSDKNESDSNETVEQRKARILSSHSAKDIYKNKDLFSDKEIQDAYLRLNNERNIKNLIPEEISKGQQFVDMYVNTGKTVKQIIDTSSDLYGSYMKGKGLITAMFKKTK